MDGGGEAAALDAVRRHLERWGVAFAPDAPVNGEAGFHGEDAQDLVLAVADAVGLSHAALERFPFERYFPVEQSLSLLPFVLLQRLFGGGPPAAEVPPLTARALAAIVARLRREEGSGGEIG